MMANLKMPHDAHESNDPFHQALMEGPIVIAHLSNLKSWNIEAISPNIERFGYQQAEFIDQSLPFIHIVHPQDRFYFIEAHDAFFTRKISYIEVEYRILRKDGGLRWLNDVTYLMQDKNTQSFSFKKYLTDVTDRKFLELAWEENAKMLQLINEQSEKANAQLRSILESTESVSIVALDSQYQYTAFNETHFNFVKRIKAVEIDIGFCILTLFDHPNDYAHAKACYDRALAGEQFTALRNYEDKSLCNRYYENQYNPIRSSEGAVIGITIFITDITDRILTENALRESEKKYSNIFNHLQDVYFEINLQGDIYEVSPSIEDITSIPREKIIGTNVTSFITDKRKNNQLWALLKKNKKVVDYEITLENEKKENEKKFSIPCSTNLRMLYREDKKDWIMVGSLRDISDRKRIEANFERELFINKTLAEISDVILSPNSTLDTIIQAILQSAIRLTQSIKGCIHSNDHYFGDPLEVEWEFLSRNLGISYQNHSASFRLQPFIHNQPDNLIERTNPSEFSLETNSIPLHILYFPVIFREECLGHILLASLLDPYDQKDIDSVKRLADFFAITMERHRINEMLVLEKNNAEHASLAKTTFLANMSHEIRTPLNAILGYTQILQKHTNLTLSQKESLDIVLKSGFHLLGLIDDILDLSKIEVGKMHIDSIVFNLKQFVQEISDMFILRAKEKGLGYRVDIDSSIPTQLQGDERRIRQVLINLLGNAIKFTEEGEIQFSVAQTPDGTIRFLVRDSGIGIDESMAQEIFESFKQGDTRSSQKEGTGLGLAISQRLVQMMGSRIQVESTFGKGSAFWFDLNLPIPEQQIAEGIEKDSQTGRMNDIIGYVGIPIKILIVDDVAFNRNILIEFLKPLRFEIQWTDNGTDSLLLIEQWQPNLVLLDLVLPDLHGIEVMKRVRKKGFKGRIIVVSANVLESTREQCLQNGCQGFLRKPIRESDLLSSIQHQLALTWVYKDPNPCTSDLDQKDEAQSIPPPKEVLRVLVDLSSRGDIRALQTYTMEQKNSFPQSIRYFDSILTLASQYQINKIRILLSQSLEGKTAP